VALHLVYLVFGSFLSLLSSGILRGVKCKFITDVAGPIAGSIFKGQAFQYSRDCFLFLISLQCPGELFSVERVISDLEEYFFC
jgi:hypothetical protein